MSDEIFDLFIIGGGVNGCGIARDAAGRGFSVYLAEMDDLASGTSSASTKLVHGGLRYLEHYEFRLVREALEERETLWAMAPHIIEPLRFVLPHHKGLRPKWMLRVGLFIYDYIGGRKKLPPTQTIKLRKNIAGNALKRRFSTAFEYSDCRVDDARLVILNARDAANKGAQINTHTKVIRAERVGDMWEVEVIDLHSGQVETVQARSLVNAAGPWVDDVLNSSTPNDVKNVRLVKGSHVVVEKLFAHDRCYIFQNADGRVIFAIPYQDEFTLIGTTDLDYTGDASDVSISSEELNYLCEVASEYFRKPVHRAQVVWAFSGVRPLYDDGADSAQEATRDYVLRLEGAAGEAPLLNIFGGKLTTFRRLSEEALEELEKVIGEKGPAWTKGSHLPGGDFEMTGFDAQVQKLARDFPFLTPSHVHRLTRLYGTLAPEVLGSAKALVDLGESFGSNLTQREVDYLIAHEWARTADDIMWRRTKMGLRLTNRDVRALETYMQKELAGSAL